MDQQVPGTGRLFQYRYIDKKTGEKRKTRTWYLEYSVNGRQYREASGSRKRADAVRLLKRRLGEAGSGRFLGPQTERTRFEDLATMLLDDYRVNRRRSLARIEDAVTHLRESFGLMRAIDLTTDRITAYIADRQQAGAANGTINRELGALKRMFTLAMRAGKVAQRPYISMLQENNVRTGFFEGSDLRALLAHLPEYLKPVIEFAYLTGWRVRSEILPLLWAQVDFEAGIVRLEPGTTKNDDGRVFPFSVLPPLEALLRRQRERTRELERATGRITPWVFHRNGKPFRDFRSAWQTACTRAGLGGRVPHDCRLFETWRGRECRGLWP